MSCGRRIGPAILTIVLVSLAHPAIYGATVDLQVLDELDQPIDGLEIGLYPAETVLHYGQAARGITDAAGRVVLQGVDPGRYEAQAGSRDRFVRLENHPLLRPPSITVEHETDTLRTTLRFVRGVPVVFRVAAEGSELPGATLMLRDLDHDYSTQIPLRRMEREIRLTHGRWTAAIRPVPGYLLTSVEVNREALPGHVAELDLIAGDLTSYASFEYAAPATIWGYVVFRGERFGVRVVARLQEPGPWLQAARERGGSVFDEVRAGPDSRGNYEMVVPDGRWLVTAEGDDLVSAEPQQVEVVLQPGQEQRVDFTVRGEESPGPGLLTVEVRDPTDLRVGGAVVEIWPEDPVQREEEPLARERTHRWGTTSFRGLGADTYAIVAGHPGYVEGSAVSPPPERNERNRRRVLVRLQRGATLHTVAREDDVPVAGVEVVLTRLEPFESMLASDEIQGWIQRPHGTTDETGHLWLRGIYPGRYRMSGTVARGDGEWSFVEFHDSAARRWSREPERVYAGERTDEIEIRLAPAGGLRARLHCSDGSPLPEEADVLVLPADRVWSGRVTSAWLADAVLNEKALVLEQRARDRLTVGPLESGPRHLLVRPLEHNRWTWAIGTESPSEAAVISVVAGELTDLGAVAVDCAPAVAVRPLPPDGWTLPDLAAATWFDPVAELSGTITRDDEVRRLPHSRLRLETDGVQFRDLPEGLARLSAIVRSPFFLPDPEQRVDIETRLERGRTVELEPPVVGIGGAIEIPLPDDLAAVVVAARALPLQPGEKPVKPKIWAVHEGRVRIPSLVAGAYRIEICVEPTCAEPRSLREPLEVVPGLVVSP